ncbi:hypothetical protein KAFR_0B02270 [Kazachstania africana CBS 2517]|uniref:Uncharacterized protein n=1 Tax=Kazachstania africana (strain ATCC 22294 / BCRC 22015 / CBS 2517 / CECT 1963 / NBRC 1671 / NRRL Y-8276) TaxID=1071382 RepID=H2AQ75_KAZAF|nr:hypothetical protein KAFR_0B02270 [Kazachstania africana CBS 2517]CCF56525.1 hypothetical protein KAFR_0B02270 [Kazachstania africana CBS 2517]
MVKIPLHVEKFMLYTLLASFDSFLYYFTVLPMKIVVDFCRKPNLSSWIRKTYKERLTLFMILVSSFVLSRLDTSKVYHKVKRQSVMKLYMLFSILEIADKMLSTMGQSLVSVLLSKRNHDVHYRYKQILLVPICSLYLICHGFLLIYQSIALNVAVNSYSNSLLTLLLSIQFAEIKASVFKKFDTEGLFQITISDTVERFKLVILLLIIIIRNFSAMPLSLNMFKSFGIKNEFSIFNLVPRLWIPMITFVGSEILIDWIKHAYIIKFNRIRPIMYDKFYYIMYKDHSTSFRKYQDRLGLPLPAYVIISIVMIRPTIHQMLHTSHSSFLTSILVSSFIIMIIFIALSFLKFSIHTILVKWEKRIELDWTKKQNNTVVSANDFVPGLVSDGRGQMDHQAREIIFSDMSEKTVETKAPSSANVGQLQNGGTCKGAGSLESVSRYKMVSKRIW